MLVHRLVQVAQRFHMFSSMNLHSFESNREHSLFGKCAARTFLAADRLRTCLPAPTGKLF